MQVTLADDGFEIDDNSVLLEYAAQNNTPLILSITTLNNDQENQSESDQNVDNNITGVVEGKIKLHKNVSHS